MPQTVKLPRGPLELFVVLHIIPDDVGVSCWWREVWHVDERDKNKTCTKGTSDVVLKMSKKCWVQWFGGDPSTGISKKVVSIEKGNKLK